MVESFYQTVNFHFKVEFTLNEEDVDVRFQSVSGLDVSLETEQVKEGGENRFEHVVPVRRKCSPLILKRGLLKPSASGLTRWLQKAFDEENVEPIKTVVIKLLNEEHKPLMLWTINNVWPRSWKMGELNAENGAVLIETLELNYNRILLSEP
jgi:phage tail-like protein